MAAAIVVAGGKGARMAAAVRKQYLEIGGRPILAHTLLAFDGCALIDKIYLVAPREDFNYCRKELFSALTLNKKIVLVAGGAKRQDSVYNGLTAVDNLGSLPEESQIVVIHDGVRPFVHPDQITRCIQEAQMHKACILGVPAFDTLKQVNSNNKISATLDRSWIWMAQTPQAFHIDVITEAHKHAQAQGLYGTDDAWLVEQTGQSVKIIPGSRFNIKITSPEDLELARAIIDTGCWRAKSFL